MDRATYRVSDGGTIEEPWGKAHFLELQVDTFSGSASQGCVSDDTEMHLVGEITLRSRDDAFVSARLVGKQIDRAGSSGVVREKSGDWHCGKREPALTCQWSVERSIERACFQSESHATRAP